MTDASGAVAAILQRYRAVLLGYQHNVTGEPATLRAAAQALSQDAQQLTAHAQSIRRAADSLAAGWTGTAYDAYRSSAHRLADDVDAASRAVRERADRLTAQAGALESARTAMDRIIQWFDGNANALVSSAATANPAAVGLFQEAATRLGEQAVALAKQVADQLGKALLGPDPKGITLFDASLHGFTYGQTFSNGVLLQGGAHYSLGPHVELTPDYERDAKGTKIGGIDLNLLRAGANGSMSDGRTTVAGNAEANADLKATWDHGDIDLLGTAGAKGQLSVTDKDGAFSTKDQLEAQADATAHLKIGEHGVQESAELGASATVSRTYSVEGGGFKFDGMAGVGVGLHDQEAVTAGYENGHLKLGVGATVIDGVGLKGSVNLDVDLPKVGGEIADGARSLYHGAASAAQSVAESYSKALESNPMAFVP